MILAIAKSVPQKFFYFGIRFAAAAILAVRPPQLPFWQVVCHFDIGTAFASLPLWQG
jgi:hypothetical protein